jgi:hypothetical protein
MTDPFSIEINSDALTKVLADATTDMRGRLAAALFEEGEEIMARSKSEFVPVETGVLRASGYVEAPVIEGEDISVTLGFGGAASAYALKQHEDTTLHHPNGGQAKYLEQPLLEAAATLAEHLADKIRS